MTAPRTVPPTARSVVAVLLTVLAGVAAVATGPAASAEDVTWTVRTASNAFGSDRTGYSYGIDPGTTVEDALVVANHGDQALELAVYAADGYTTDAGRLDLLTRDVDSSAVGAWLQTQVDTVTVEPGGSVEVPFTLAVPADATPGDYAGGVVTSLVQADAAEGITVDRRLGIRVDVRVGGELRPALAVEDVHLTYDGTANPAGAGDATVTYTVHNTGNQALSAEQAVAVTGPFGRLRVEAPTVEAPPQLLPGERWTVTVPVPDVVPAVRLGAEVAVTPVLVDASGSTSRLDAVRAGGGAWAVPWATLAVAVVLVGAALAVPRVVRARRRARAEQEAQRTAQAVEQALAELSANA
ncbi:WxL protein peptidoglycan domain-containing protein [Cellulomonas soli]|uniref:WxL protein peptidoglycan domain-containing protein n=1 Tax=Cellulomonas soli TaxID=931535 RepID=UPI003F858F2A